MTMLVIMKSIIWKGDTCTRVCLRLPLHLTDAPLLSVSRPRTTTENRGEEKKKVKARENFWPKWLNRGCLCYQTASACENNVLMCSKEASLYFTMWWTNILWHKTENLIIGQKPSVPPWSWEGPGRFVVPVPGEGPLPPPVSGERPAKTKTSHYATTLHTNHVCLVVRYMTTKSWA